VPTLLRGNSEAGRPYWRDAALCCRSCCRTCIDHTGTPFAGHRWPQEIIVTAVRWYVRFRLPAADVRDLLAERGVDVSARTVLYWVQQCAPPPAPRRCG